MRPSPEPVIKRSPPPCCSIRTLILLEGFGFWLSLLGFDLRTWVFLSLLLVSFHLSQLALGVSVLSGVFSLGSLFAVVSQFFHFFADSTDPLLASVVFRVAPYPILFYLLSNVLISLCACYTFPSLCNFACPLLGFRCHWRPPCAGAEASASGANAKARRSSDASAKGLSRSSSASTPLRIDISSSSDAHSSDAASLQLASAGDELECALLSMFRQSRAVLALVFLLMQLLLLLFPACVAATLGAHPVRLMLVPMFALAAILYLYLHLVVSRVGWRLAQRLSRAVRNFDALNGRQRSATGRAASTTAKALSLKCILSSSGNLIYRLSEYSSIRAFYR